MKKYSITKYLKNSSRKEDEWTSISDIGKVYNGKQLCIEDYKKTENAYVYTVLKIAKCMEIKKFRIKNVFRWKDLVKEVLENQELRKLYPDSMLQTYEMIENDSIIDLETLSDLVRLELREDIGGLLYVPYRLKVFIGYDYMMGIHSSMSLENIFEYVTSQGLNIYQFK